MENLFEKQAAHCKDRRTGLGGFALCSWNYHRLIVRTWTRYLFTSTLTGSYAIYMSLRSEISTSRGKYLKKKITDFIDTMSFYPSPSYKGFKELIIFVNLLSKSKCYSILSFVLLQ